MFRALMVLKRISLRTILFAFVWIAASVTTISLVGWQVPMGVTAGLTWAGLLAYPWRRNNDAHLTWRRILRRLGVGSIFGAIVYIGTIILFDRTPIVDLVFTGEGSRSI